MTAAISKKEPKPVQKADASTTDVSKIIEDIRSKFPGFSIKHLWSTDNCHRFRINLFTTENGVTQVSRSHFIQSTIDAGKILHEIKNNTKEHSTFLKDIDKEKKEDVFWTSN